MPNSPLKLTLRNATALTIALSISSGCSSAAEVTAPGKPVTQTIPAPAKVTVNNGDLFVAAHGTADNPGTQAKPTTLENAIAKLAPGQTIWVLGGTYNFPSSLSIKPGNNGSAAAPKRLYALGDESPVFNFSGQPVANSSRGLIVNGNFWHLKGITVERAGDNGIYIGGSYNTVELCVTRFNADSGLQIARAASDLTDIAQWPSNNLILNCTSHDNKDPGNENADGFACKLTSGTGNVFRGCIAHHNIDDGWDLFAKKETGPIGPVLIENCVAYSNGALSDGASSGSGDKNGFKLGGSGIAVPHIVRNSFAFNNGKHGFTDNNNPGPMDVRENISVRNKESNFNFRDGGTHVFTGNISFESGKSDKFIGTLTGTTNIFWHNKKGSQNNGGTSSASEADFISLIPPTQVGRKADGSPDLGDFLRLKADSDLLKLTSASK